MHLRMVIGTLWPNEPYSSRCPAKRIGEPRRARHGVGGGCPDDRRQCGGVLIVEPPGKLLEYRHRARPDDPRALWGAAAGQRPSSATSMTHQSLLRDAGTLVSDAVLIMIERGFRHLPIVGPAADPRHVFRCATRCRVRSARRRGHGRIQRTGERRQGIIFSVKGRLP